MLQSIRDSVTGWAAGLLLFVIALAFVFWGIDFGFLGQTAVASVNGEEIPPAQIRQAVQNQLTRYQQFYQQGVPPELEDSIRQNVVGQLVRNEVLAQYTDEAGYRIGDRQLGEAIKQMEVFQEGGRFSTELYKTRLAIEGRSVAAFQEQMRRGLTITQMQEVVARSAFVTPSEREREQRLRNEKREVAHAVFAVSDFADSVSIDDAGVQIYYENNKPDFMTPQTVDLEYVELDASTLADAAELTDDDVRTYYREEVDAGRFSAPAERRASHILIVVDDDTDDAAAESLANELTTQAQEGADFAALAAEHSDDAGSSSLGGDLGWNEQAALTGAMRDAIFAMAPGEIRGPVKSEFGYHVVRLDEMRGGNAKPFDEVADELRAELKQRRADEAYFDLRDRLIELAYESDGLVAPADALDLKVRNLTGITRSGGAGIAADSKVIEAAFSPRVLEEGANSDLVDLDDTRSVVIRVAKSEPPRQLALEDVRPRIEATLKNRAARDAAREAGRKAVDGLKAGEDLQSVATRFGGDYNEPVTVGRDDSTLPPALREKVFAAARPGESAPSVDGVALPNGNYAVFAVMRIVPGEAEAADPAQAEQATAQIASAEFNALTEALTEKAKVVIRIDQLQ